MHSTEGSRDPAPVAGPQGDTLGRGSRFGENDVPLAVSPGRPLSLLRTA
jgi:hypothetical protein